MFKQILPTSTTRNCWGIMRRTCILILMGIYICNRLQLIARLLQEVKRGCKRELISVDLSCTIHVLKKLMFTQEMPIRCVCRIWLLSCASAICFHGFNIAESISPKLKNPTVTLYMQDFSLILHVFFVFCTPLQKHDFNCEG